MKKPSKETLLKFFDDFYKPLLVGALLLIDKRTAYMAAKSGLADAGFTIKRASFEKGFAIGEHGMTPYDWNVVAGVYIQTDESGAMFKTIVEGSKDIGFWGDMTERSWTEAVLKGIRQYIQTESSISDPDKNIFN